MIHKTSAAADEIRRLARAHRDASPAQEDKAKAPFPLDSSHEVVFELRDGKPTFVYVGWVLDPEALELELSRNWERRDLDDNDVKLVLGEAEAYGVPVYANTPDDEVALATYYRSLIREGIQGPEANDSGPRGTYRLTRYADKLGTPEEVLKRVSRTEVLSQGEMRVVRDMLEQRIADNVEAATLLAGLRAGISELAKLLDEEHVKEAQLQACLTENPLLFGTHYRQIKPKHRLGNQYEMDYALIRHGGLVDVVEIERSSDPVYTRSRGDPSSRLVHAEQQVLDWLAWIDNNPRYTSEYLPGIERPVGYVVIGRDAALEHDQRAKLKRRNRAFMGSLEILTFDDLLHRGRALLRALTGLGQPGSGAATESGV
jgi:hypothetical protein